MDTGRERISMVFWSPSNLRSSIFAYAYCVTPYKDTLEITTEMIPYPIALLIKGNLIKLLVAPTNCILRIRNLCENKASLIVLLMRRITIKTNNDANAIRIKLILVIFLLIESTMLCT